MGYAKTSQLNHLFGIMHFVVHQDSKCHITRKVTIKDQKKATPPLLKYVLASIISIVLIVLIIIFFIRRQNKKTKNLNKKDSLSLITWRRVSYLDIQ